MARPEFKEKKECFWCRREGANFVIDEKDTMLVMESRDKEAQLQAAASRFMEFFVFDFCFSSPVPSPGTI